MTGRIAAAKISQVLCDGDWRLLIGEDAEAINAHVWAHPWSAYDLR